MKSCDVNRFISKSILCCSASSAIQGNNSDSLKHCILISDVIQHCEQLDKDVTWRKSVRQGVWLSFVFDRGVDGCLTDNIDY